MDTTACLQAREKPMNYEVKQNDVIGAEALYRLGDYLPYRLSLLASSLNSAFETTLERDHNLGLTDWRVMATLGEYGSLTARDICQRGRIHNPRTAQVAATAHQPAGYARSLFVADRAWPKCFPAGCSGRRDLQPQDHGSAFLAGIALHGSGH
jgi:hypothetical protein